MNTDEAITSIANRFRDSSGEIGLGDVLEPVAFVEMLLQRYKDAMDRIGTLTVELDTLREAISPGRIGDLDYYVGVAKKLREKQAVIRPI